jgi:apolipoprotein N-acyltransferase
MEMLTSTLLSWLMIDQLVSKDSRAVVGVLVVALVFLLLMNKIMCCVNSKKVCKQSVWRTKDFFRRKFGMLVAYTVRLSVR